MKKIAIIVYDGCWAMSVMMLKDFFHVVNLLSIRQGQAESYQVDIFSLDGLAKLSASGPSIEVDDKVRRETTYDLVILPSFEGNLLIQIQEENDDLIDWLKSQIQQQTPILALTTAAYFLAATQQLQHVLLATHWAFLRELKRLFPLSSFTANRNYLQNEQIYTTGTLLGTFDALLGIVAQQKGDYFAQLCASHLLMHAPQELNPVLPDSRNHRDEAVLQVQDWLDINFPQENRIADLAKQFNFSERNLKRRFQLATQISPNQYLQQVRVDKAKKLLLTTEMNVQQIAYAVGYENVSFFIRVFKKITGCTPSQWLK
ncbi:helix-turn-helix domain-containing protein [Acinetobacter sp. C26M]|uniref:GlxA family transcriptional regulator n=1 Tax=unclassified Acinetobacter TaxID=196816 RepID=UPI0020372AFE|nr:MULTISPECIES: helix-turn-helix domain-containing protein [unclassified Acinetobacter]USA45214.1 helix-turn-helix domain-containing protein [Acinetobacter sp. C26M]USA48716.1 helix-turn-helix domain-containing protein [Acinetobacter sp. C26G]